MKNKVLLLTLLMSLSGCAIMPLSSSSSINSNDNDSSVITNTSSSEESSVTSSTNTNSSTLGESSNNDYSEKTLVIDLNNFNTLSYIKLEGVENSGYKPNTYTFNANGTMKSKEIKGIKEIKIRVYNTYDNLDLFTNYNVSGNPASKKFVEGNKEATYTYNFEGINEFCIKNTSSEHRTHVYSVTITYTGNAMSGSGNNSSSNTSSSSSSSSSSNKPSSSSSSSEEKEQIYTQGLKGSEYLKYYGESTGCTAIPSVGTPDMLVVPVLFKGETPSNASKALADIDATFNGSSDEVGWESVDSYYKKTSYNHLDLDIDVYDEWITLDKTCNDLAKLTNYADPTWYAVDYVVKTLKNKGVDMKQYDSNSDGFIDGIWLVYGKNYSSATSAQEDILWAYTYWMYENTPNVNNPVANCYAWASIEFMYEGGYSKPDAHTFIHETGHMLGLDDYYDYTENSSLAPAGCLDMMDYNIGDHNAYSKYLLDWVDPTYVSKSSSITIGTFESSGGAIIVPSSLSDYKSPLNEYLIIEFYTPTGLNKLDSSENYGGNYPKLFTENGVKIYHVDSRIGELEYTYDWTYKNYVYNYSYNDLVSKTGYDNYFQIFNSNTPEYSYNNNNKLLTLLSSNQDSKKNYYYKDTYASNKDLYQEGDSIKSFTFNRGTSLPFEIYIDDISSNSATIRFVKK